MDTLALRGRETTMTDTTQDIPAHIAHWQAYLRHSGRADAAFDILREMYKLPIDRESLAVVREMLLAFSDRETASMRDEFDKYCRASRS